MDEGLPLHLSNKDHEKSSWSAWRLVGPGLFACLADTDAGCLIVAGQSGSRWKYSLLAMQVLLIPVLYWAQELTIRLGVHTRKGHTACIKEHFGAPLAWSMCFVLVIECVGALISEISGVAAVAKLVGVAETPSAFLAAAIIVFVVFVCDYKTIELIGCALGFFELTFVLTMFLLHPSPSAVFAGLFTTHFADPDWRMLITSNLGAVIMPWMIYFQQSAVVARRLTTARDVEEERAQTLFGAVLTQLVMIGTLVSMAAASRGARNLEHVSDFATALSPALGQTMATLLVSLAFLGGSLCASFVVSLAAAWAVGEAMGKENTSFSLELGPREAPLFYGCFLVVVALGTGILISGVNVVRLNVAVELMDGLLMPFAVGTLFLLAASDLLPPEVRLVGWWKNTLGVIFGIIAVLGLFVGVSGLMLGTTFRFH